jgi:hypothetical protein
MYILVVHDPEKLPFDIRKNPNQLTPASPKNGPADATSTTQLPYSPTDIHGICPDSFPGSIKNGMEVSDVSAQRPAIPVKQTQTR